MARGRPTPPWSTLDTRPPSPLAPAPGWTPSPRAWLSPTLTMASVTPRQSPRLMLTTVFMDTMGWDTGAITDTPTPTVVTTMARGLLRLTPLWWPATLTTLLSTLPPTVWWPPMPASYTPATPGCVSTTSGLRSPARQTYTAT